MKKSTFIISILIAITPATKADEGMWTLYNLPEAVYQTMQSEGFTLPYNNLYQGENALKNAVVNFSGYCSGVVVSPDGLVFTNHHCGFESIRSHSTVQHDYMLNGFVAKKHTDELPNENMFVSFMRSQKDITDQVNKLGYNQLKSDRKEALIDSLQNAMTHEVQKQDSTLHVNIDAFYEGNKWYATTYQDYPDIRLVYAPPRSMGKFGGETDNWMWPRQTCDVSVFRIYANPQTNGPAKYSKTNVPYHPKRWARVSLQGYVPGDYAMTIGYPGSTERYLSSYGIQMMRDDENTPRAQVRGVKQDVMLRHMHASEAVRIKYDSKFANSSNYWKNSIGMNKCIDSVGIINIKRQYEQRIALWQDTTHADVHKVDFELLRHLYEKASKLQYAFTNWSETFTRRSNVEFNSRALKLYHGMPIYGPKNHRNKQYQKFEDNSAEWDAPTDKEIMTVLLKNYREHVDASYWPVFYKTIDEKFGGDYQKYVDYLYDKRIIMKSGKKIFSNCKSYKKDPGVQYGIDVMDIYADIQEKLGKTEDSIVEQEKYLCAAKIRMEQDMPHYSDANFTMRLSYGQVGGFELGGKPSGYYTSNKSMIEKMEKGNKGVTDYQAEPIFQQLMARNDFGRYTDKTTKDLHLCFLTNNDITGGNSGSPVFNGKGELIGLAFDGNWDSLSSDIRFDKNLARCICVDIRYILYVMDQWGHAENLLQEINPK